MALAILLLLPLHWWWRRRGRPRPGRCASWPDPARPPLERWAEAGEAARGGRGGDGAAPRRDRRPAAEGATPRLDTDALLATCAPQRPDWPLRELGDLLRSLDEARFGDDAVTDASELARRAAELEPRLRRGGRVSFARPWLLLLLLGLPLWWWRRRRRDVPAARYSDVSLPAAVSAQALVGRAAAGAPRGWRWPRWSSPPPARGSAATRSR